MARYTRVTVRPFRVSRYPFKATEMVFTLPRNGAVQAVEMLMAYMDYGSNQYGICSAVDVSQRKSGIDEDIDWSGIYAEEISPEKESRKG
jgi:hypothetical protein